MFGFLKPKLAPGGPVELRFDVVIEKAVEEVYALVDWADPHNAKRELGDHVSKVEGAPDRFRMILNELPDHVFEISVSEEMPHASYGFTSEIAPPIGRLVRAHELYSFEPLSAGSCRVTLVTTATFVGALPVKQYALEIQTMTVACVSAMAKLKIHAEEGVEAVRAGLTDRPSARSCP